MAKPTPISKEDVEKSMLIDREIARNTKAAGSHSSEQARAERDNKKLKDYQQKIIFDRQTTDSNNR